MNVEDISSERPAEPTENQCGGGSSTTPAEKPVNDGGGSAEPGGEPYTDP